MTPVKLSGHIDEQHRLVLDGSPAIEPGPVVVWVFPASVDEDEAGQRWEAAIATEWRDELEDVAQDIYTLDDGLPLP